MLKSNITSPTAAFVNPETGLITQEWYRYLFSLFKPNASATAVLDFPSTAAQSSSDLTVSIPGVLDGDIVTVGVPNACMLANSCYTGWVSAAGVVTVRFNNYSSAAQNPASGSFRVVVTRL